MGVGSTAALLATWVTDRAGLERFTAGALAVTDDQPRIEYMRTHLSALKAAIDAGVDVRGFFYWSLMDNFEWQKGYAMQFGLVAVDRVNGLARTPKPSLACLGSYRG